MARSGGSLGSKVSAQGSIETVRYAWQPAGLCGQQEVKERVAHVDEVSGAQLHSMGLRGV